MDGVFHAVEDEADVEFRVARDDITWQRIVERRAGNRTVNRIDIRTRELRQAGAGVEVGGGLASLLAASW